MRYEGAVYRPPSEASSLIIQLTIGCARNTCTFCSMYKDKKFRVRDLQEVIEDLYIARKYYHNIPIKRIFLADGDAFIVKTPDLLFILNKIKEVFPEVERITMYAAPKDILAKTPQELFSLKEAGLDMVYMGLESGSDRVLEFVKKGATKKEMIEAGKKIRAAKIKLSITIIAGLGSLVLSKEHAAESADVISQINPEYVGYLTLMLEPEAPMYAMIEEGTFSYLTPTEVLQEIRTFLDCVDSDNTVFRSNHASNYVSLAGNLNRDKNSLIEKIDTVLANHRFKPEYYRGL